MSRQFDPEEDPEDEERPGSGHIRTTGAGALVGWALTGLVLGWLLQRLTGSTVTLGWLPVLALLFVALIIGSVAWSTYRSFHRRHERIEPHRAVNRLVLAKSCALAGAMVAGGYFGYALGFLGRAGLAQGRVAQALVGGFAGVLIVAFSLLLERACRVGGDDKRDIG